MGKHIIHDDSLVLMNHLKVASIWHSSDVEVCQLSKIYSLVWWLKNDKLPKRSPKFTAKWCFFYTYVPKLWKNTYNLVQVLQRMGTWVFQIFT